MATNKKIYAIRRFIYLFLFILLFYYPPSGSVRAEVTLDGTLGPSGSIPGPDYQITADLGQQVGANLFHSFGKFNVNTGESAIFSGPGSISNIISRVTGGTSSWIDGYLRSEITGANLYLINPSGVMFGPNASLDVSGSFHVSTANYLKLGEDGWYYATTPGNSVLTSAPPSAFGFLGLNPKSISFDETFLEVPSGKTISVIGGDIHMHNSTLHAQGGRIDLASAASAGEVFPNETDLVMEGFTEQGNVAVLRDTDFTNYSDIDLSGALLSDEDGGAVYIRSGRFELQGGKIDVSTSSINPGGGVNIQATDHVEVDSNGITSGGNISSLAYWIGQAGDIFISTEELIMDNTAYMSTGTIGFGDAGNMRFDVGSLTMTGGSQVSTNALNVFGTGFEIGHGGDIVVNAAESILISGYDNAGNLSGLYANTSTQGDAGNITMVTPSLLMDQLGVLSAKTGSTANSGAISLNVENLSIKGGASIGTETFLGGGRGGDITVNASKSVVISEESLDLSGLLSPSGLFASTGFGGGPGGNINITTPYFLLDQGGQVQTISSFDGGDAGQIKINVNNLSLTKGGGLAVSADGSGQGGDIIITATESIEISGNDSGIDATSFSSGNAGNITLDSSILAMHDKGTITALTAGSGQGGQINISATNNITINDSDISTTSAGSGNGGTIFLNMGNLQMDNNASISAKGKDTGRGGDITIQAADSIRLLNDSSITTETLQSDGGNIEIKASDLIYLFNSGITTSVQGGLGNGGNIAIDPRFVILNNSSIIANAYGGNGGNIDIVSYYFIASTDSIVQASSQLGISGTINITAADLDLSGSLTVLPSNYLDATSLLRDRCEAMSDENTSSLVIEGRGGMPIEPDDYLPSP